MSSGQWEVVGKGKKEKNGKVKKDERRNGGKLEDISNRNNGLDGDVKKNGGKNKKNKVEKKSEPLKTKIVKTLDAALQAIDPNDLSFVITSNKSRFSNAPLVWLKELAYYLNSKTQIEVEDPTFSKHPPAYPLCVLPTNVKDILVKMLQDAGKANCQIFFDVTLTAVANDMSRAGQWVNGYRLLLQLLAHEYPDFCEASILKSINLRNSYQNRPPIGLTLLWAFGQGGYKNFNVGLKVWQELFLPIIEMKNYTKYIMSYITNLVDAHVKMQTLNVSQEELLSLFDSINGKRNVSKELSSDLIKQLTKIKEVFFKNNSNKLQVTFNQLMKKLPNQYIECNNLDKYNTVLIECLIDCLERDDTCNASWKQLFLRCSKQSATLLSYIFKNWDTVTKRLKVKSLNTTIAQYQDVCTDALKGKKKDEAIIKANKICQEVMARKINKPRKSRKGFPWFWASFFLLFTIGAVIVVDVSKAGGEFPKSVTGRLLNDLGILEQTQHVWRKSLSTSAKGYIWLEENAPIYYHQAANISKPYIELARDVAIVGANNAVTLYGNLREYVVEKAPIVQAKVDDYVPGLVDSVASYSAEGWKFTKNTAINLYTISSEVLREKVFVGHLSPQNIQDKTHLAYNVTRTRVTEYLHWVRHQIHVYSEIP